MLNKFFNDRKQVFEMLKTCFFAGKKRMKEKPLTMLMKTILRFYALLNIRKVIRSQFKKNRNAVCPKKTILNLNCSLQKQWAGLAGVTVF